MCVCVFSVMCMCAMYCVCWGVICVRVGGDYISRLGPTMHE